MRHYRYNIFKGKLQEIESRNRVAKESGSTVVHGITRFADIRINELLSDTVHHYQHHVERKASILAGNRNLSRLNPAFASSSQYVNWKGIYTTPVRDQGVCNCCYAFLVAEQLESDSIRQGILQTSDWLSVEQILGCSSIAALCNGNQNNCPQPSSYTFGCQDSDPYNAINYVISAGGLQLDSSYPYPSSTYGGQSPTSCQSNPSAYVTTISSYTRLLPNDEGAMANYLLSTGPFFVLLDASTWDTYTSGVMGPSDCGKSVTHGAQVVGLDLTNGYWIVSLPATPSTLHHYLHI